MGEFRNRTTGEIKTQGELRRDNPNMSMPRVWGASVCDALNVDPILASKKPTEGIGQYQFVARNGAVQDASDNWVEAWEIKDMFADTTDEDGKKTTKAEHEAAYQATLDARVAEGHRVTRNKLLADTDWTQVNDSPLANDVKTQWAVYRSELRNITDLDEWPNLADEDWPIAP